MPASLCHSSLIIPRRTIFHKGTFFQPATPPTSRNHTATAMATAPVLSDEGIAAEEVQPRPPPAPLVPLSKDQLLSLVDQYDEGTLDDHLKILQDPYMRGYAPSDGPNLQVWKAPHDYHYPSLDDVLQPDADTKQTLWNLRFAVVTRLRSPHRADLDTIYQLYRQLPEPRISYLHARLRHQLLRVLGSPDKKDFKSMVQYFSVIADVKNNGILLTVSEWNNSVSFASRYVGMSTEVEAQSALKLWREMEQEASITANEVTFNILFDVASKAGNFVLAEMIYREMRERRHPFNRYHHVSLIHFFGLQKDSSGLRAAYREMVNQGEIVDTLTLNCVISGLLRCGEDESAEYVHRRMKALSPQNAEGPSPSAMTGKAITKVLMMFARMGRKHPDLYQPMQNAVLVGPNLSTYRILVTHAASIGNLARVARYLEEMKQFDIPTHGAIFLALFKGFHRHGGYPGSQWSEQRLNNVWNALLRALDEGTGGLEIKTWMVIWALKAFKTCSTPRKVREVYNELAMRWHFTDGEEQFIMSFYTNLR
ncbi:hypothetical protein GQ53DRAFT_755398 [Thozetella sp. PMI_491]|nr:hypothetical protein GQ53DRAFT_755398 [Thozetella sp. PMI_491]